MPHAYTHAFEKHGGRTDSRKNSRKKSQSSVRNERINQRESSHFSHSLKGSQSYQSSRGSQTYQSAPSSQSSRRPVDIDENLCKRAAAVDAGSHGTNTSEAQEGVRLQKVLAQAGYGSRRKCENLIREGRVEVDGTLVTELGTRVFPKKQRILVDGSRVKLNDHHVTLALNKPRRVLSAMDDPHGRWTLRDIIGDGYERIFHMGRLDYDSEGLILMTDDGELAQHVMHPKYEIEKTYIATVQGKMSGATAHRLVTQGVHLKDGWVKFDRAIVLESNREHSIVRVTLHSGKNRVVRRMMQAVGYPVTRLMRVQIGPIRLGETRPGSYRILSATEVKSLEQEVGL